MILIADSGATKAAWCLSDGASHTYLETPGINPYFLKSRQIEDLLQTQLVPQLSNASINQISYYGAGCGKIENARCVEKSLKKVFPNTNVSVATDLTAAAKSLCGHQPGVACILGTGSNSCVFDGEKVIKNNPAPGFILGDEGSGAYLGKKVLQHFIYHTFDDELMQQFEDEYKISYNDILEQVYRQPQPNRYLASFTTFLTANRGHFMIENIIEDGLNDFFFTHLYKYTETWTQSIHFTGSIAWYFRDVLDHLCHAMEIQLGNVVKAPIEGLVAYHTTKA